MIASLSLLLDILISPFKTLAGLEAEISILRIGSADPHPQFLCCGTLAIFLDVRGCYFGDCRCRPKKVQDLGNVEFVVGDISSVPCLDIA
jgi:hypothetical protein